MSTGTCPDCFSGTLSTNSPSGTITTIHNLPTYIATPEAGIKPKGLVVIIADAFGYSMPNSQVLADQYAKKGGLLVYIPDFMAGSAMDSSLMDTMKKIMTPASWFTTLFIKPLLVVRAVAAVLPFFIKNRLAVMKPRVFKFFQALRSSPPPFPTNDLKIGAVGICWGGKHAVLLAQDAPSSRVHAYNPSTQIADGHLASLIDCAFTAHPSMLSVPGDIEAVTRPLSVSIGSDDMALKADLIVKMKDILEKKGDDHECVILPGAKHGFSVRTDPEDEVQMSHAATAEKQAINWFTKWFS